MKKEKKECDCIKNGEMVGVNHVSIIIAEDDDYYFSIAEHCFICKDGKEKHLYVTTGITNDDPVECAIATAMALVKLYPTSLAIIVIDIDSKVIDEFNIADDMKNRYGSELKRLV